LDQGRWQKVVGARWWLDELITLKLTNMADKSLRCSKLYTIWHYGIIFFRHKDELKAFMKECDNHVYVGKFDKLPKRKARMIAEIHPKFNEYFKQTMAALFKTYGANRNGTENPLLALASLKSKEEWRNYLPYVGIWKIVN
jgi:hypothetical protein